MDNSEKIKQAIQGAHSIYPVFNEPGDNFVSLKFACEKLEISHKYVREIIACINSGGNISIEILNDRVHVKQIHYVVSQVDEDSFVKYERVSSIFGDYFVAIRELISRGSLKILEDYIERNGLSIAKKSELLIRENERLKITFDDLVKKNCSLTYSYKEEEMTQINYFFSFIRKISEYKCSKRVSKRDLEEKLAEYTRGEYARCDLDSFFSVLPDNCKDYSEEDRLCNNLYANSESEYKISNKVMNEYIEFLEKENKFLSTQNEDAKKLQFAFFIRFWFDDSVKISEKSFSKEYIELQMDKISGKKCRKCYIDVLCANLPSVYRGKAGRPRK